MTKSRTALLTLAAPALAWPAAAVAEPEAPTAEAVLAEYREQIRRVVEVDCRRDLARGEIVVCGRSLETERQALPLAAPLVAGRIERLPGEAPTGSDALAAAEFCLRLCNVGIHVDVIGAVEAIGRGVDRILHPD